MKRNVFVCLFCLVCILFVYGFVRSAQANDTGELKTLYSTFIDDLISRCESKKAMCNSKCESIRRSVSLYILKASFYKYRKEELVEELIKEQIGIKSHKIYYYLNGRFFGIFRDAMKCVGSRSQLQRENQSQ